jgi:hypothetical protein
VTVIRMFQEPLLTLALGERLLLLDLLTTFTVYLALLALLSAGIRLALAFRLSRLAQQARMFRVLVVVTAVFTAAFGAVTRHRLEIELVVIAGSLAFFLVAWLLLGTWTLLRRLADAIEEALAES